MNNEALTDAAISTVDTIGQLRAEIAERHQRLVQLEDALKAQGAGVYEGDTFRVSVSVTERATVAWKSVVEKLGASRQMLKGNTRVSTVTSLRCTARLKSA
jgi:hypothetical protein